MWEPTNSSSIPVHPVTHTHIPGHQYTLTNRYVDKLHVVHSTVYQRGWPKVHAYIVNIYSKFTCLHKILLDNGTEFKSRLFTNVASTLGMKQIFCSPYYPWGTRCIENVHNFLKICIRKQVSYEHAWDKVTHIACVAYNFVPNEHAKGSVFFLMFGPHACTPLVQLLNPKLRCMGSDKSLPVLNALWYIETREPVCDIPCTRMSCWSFGIQNMILLIMLYAGWDDSCNWPKRVVRLGWSMSRISKTHTWWM